MKLRFRVLVLSLGLAAVAAAPASAQSRRPMPGGTRPGSGPARPGAGRAAPSAPIEAARRVASGPDDDRPPLVINKMRLKNPVLVFYQSPAPGTAVQQLLMDENSLDLLKTLSLDALVARREVFVDGLGNYAPPASGASAADAQKYRLTGVSLLARTEKRRPAPDGRSTYAKLRVPGPGELYTVRESAEEYRHFVGGPKMSGTRIDFSVNGLPGLDSVRAAYTLRKIDASERGAGSGDVIR